MREWNARQAADTLGVTLCNFDLANGNAQGFCRNGNQVAINPLAEHAHRTLFHELAHSQLHFDNKNQFSFEAEEMEAECTAMLVADTLGLEGLEESRGYIQNWYQGQRIPEKSAKRILLTADKILKAGQVQEPLAQTA